MNNTLKLPQISIKILSAYTYWNNISRNIPKMRRYSLGIKIDNTFSDIIELVSMAQFSPIADREKILTKAITKNDVLKFLLYTLKELNGIDTNKFIEISTKTEEVGKMLYGWKNQSIKQNNHS